MAEGDSQNIARDEEVKRSPLFLKQGLLNNRAVPESATAKFAKHGSHRCLGDSEVLPSNGLGSLIKVLINYESFRGVSTCNVGLSRQSGNG
jgi:hypothetical protein